MNKELDRTALYVILIVIGMGLLSALTSCSPKSLGDRYVTCYTFNKHK